jgi:hypothetical protein
LCNKRSSIGDRWLAKVFMFGMGKAGNSPMSNVQNQNGVELRIADLAAEEEQKSEIRSQT